MKINLLKYFLLIFGFLLSLIIYLSVVGIETDRFNNQIKNKLTKIDKKLNLDLKKIKLTLDPINFRINVKTVGPVVFYEHMHYFKEAFLELKDEEEFENRGEGENASYRVKS